MWTPSDGDVDPTRLTNCLASLAKASGAQLRLGVGVEGVVKRPDGAFEVRTDTEEVLEADIVVRHAAPRRPARRAPRALALLLRSRARPWLRARPACARAAASAPGAAQINCAGLWTRKVARMLGIEVPAVVIEHQYVISEAIPAILERQAAGLPRLPVLRDLRASSYIRQERAGLLVGPYEEECKITEWGDAPPGWWTMDLFPDALERIEENLVGCCEAVPALGEVGIASVVNGPTIWASDGLARVGRSTVPGLYDLNVQTYGIAQSLPLAHWLSALIVDGEEPYALPDLCALRFGGASPWTPEPYVHAKVAETYSCNNRVAYPFENRSAGREHLPRTPLHAQLESAGAVFGLGAGGVQYPLYFRGSAGGGASAGARDGASGGGGGAAASECRSFFDHAWAPIADAEAQHVLSAVGIAHAPFSKFVVSGAGARAWLDRLTTNALPAVGRTRLTYALTPTGRIWAEFTAVGLEDGGYYLIGARDSATLDHARLAEALPPDGSVSVIDLTSAVDALHIAGPHAPALLSSLTAGEAEAVPFLGMREMRVLGVPTRLLRVSFSGCPGYELHADAAHIAELHAAIAAHPSAFEARLKPFGSYALNALRIEKGFKLGADLDFAHYTEAGIGPFVKPGKPGGPFVGELAPDAAPVAAKRAAVFAVRTSASAAWSVPSDAPVRDAAGELVGYTTSAARGAQTGGTVALGFVLSPPHEPLPTSDGWAVEAYGESWPVELLAKPPVAVSGRPAPSAQAQADATAAVAAAAAAAVRSERATQAAG